MRVWLVEEGNAKAGSVGAPLRRVQESAGSSLHLLGTSPPQADPPSALRRLLPDVVELIVVSDPDTFPPAALAQLAELGAGLLLAARVESVERYRRLAEQHPVWFVRPAPEVDELWLALLSAAANRRLHQQWKNQAVRLQQRMDDRIIIERAKGILVHRLGIGEDEAYQRLRVESRRQRRQIREIAQSVLDTQPLIDVAAVNGKLLDVKSAERQTATEEGST